MFITHNRTTAQMGFNVDLMGRLEITQPLIYTSFSAWIVHKNNITQVSDDVKENVLQFLNGIAFYYVISSRTVGQYIVSF